jgi:ABC-type lipoprotein release transport system permease subunit
MLLVKLAWRNIFRHRGRSIVIGIILFIGAFFMMLGAGVVEGAIRGMNDNFVERFLGHVVAVSKNEKKDDVFFTQYLESLEVIQDYPAVKKVLEEDNNVSDFVPMCRGMVNILNESGNLVFCFIIGVDFVDYQNIFGDNVYAIEGKLLEKGEKGTLITAGTREYFYRTEAFWVKPEGYELVEENLSEDAKKYRDTMDIRESLVFMGMGEDNFGNDIRLPVRGVVKYKTLNDLWAFFCFMDIESFRECFGYFTAGDLATQLSDEQAALLEIDGDDDVFDTGTFIEDTDKAGTPYDMKTIRTLTERNGKEVNLDQGAYQLIPIKLKPGVTINEGIQHLNQAFDNAGVDARVIHWKKAAGSIADIASILQVILFIFVLMIFFVAAIIIMNTLSMTACERTTEIGTMRAVGAQKGFIGSMFSWETAILSFFSGGIGMCAGIVTVAIFASLRIQAGENQILNLLFGGDYFKPEVSITGFFLGILGLALVTLGAMIYPVVIARKITPLQAITRD